MITEKMLKEAWDNQILTLTTPSEVLGDKTQGDETVASIGGWWFFFGGELGDELSPLEYITQVPEDTILKEIYEVIADFKLHEDTKDEYDYYEVYLNEQGIKE